MRRLALLPSLAFALVSGSATAAEPHAPFPSPFVVEHHVVRTAAGDGEFVSETVTDTYGGSFLVSVHPSGLRTVVDFSKREIIEIDPAKGSYWTLGFGRMQELRARIAKLSRPDALPRSSRPNAVAAEIRVEDAPVSLDATTRPGARAGSRHLHASAEGAAPLDVWVDAAVSLRPEGLEALRSFEDALGGDPAAGRSPGELLHAVRVKAQGAFPVRTRRALSAAGEQHGLVEDVVTRLEPLPTFPEKLATVGPGFRRVPSPLEIVAAFEEEEAAHRAGTIR